MRAIIREILARRMPAPPQEFVAIQVSRLNEALLVAYSAMGTMNLKAVDRVVRIVRELDRYHGFVAAEKRRPAPPPRITVGEEFGAPAERAMAFGAAMFRRPEFALQDSERIEFAPGVAMAAEIADRVEAAQEDPILASIREPQQPPPAPDAPLDDRPELLRGDVIARSPQGDVAIQEDVGLDPGVARDGNAPSLGLWPRRDDRPENLPQASETIDSAPGSATQPSGSADAARAPARASERAEPGTDALKAIAPRIERPENPRQSLENVESALANGRPAEGRPRPAERPPSARPNALERPFGPQRRHGLLNGRRRGEDRPKAGGPPYGAPRLSAALTKLTARGLATASRIGSMIRSRVRSTGPSAEPLTLPATSLGSKVKSKPSPL
jgi:hypothetical protein